jgi:hypothetical protein
LWLRFNPRLPVGKKASAKMAEPDPLRPRRDTDRAQLEMLASGVTSGSGALNPTLVGEAKYELMLRDREYAEQQEKSRRDFETALADKQLRAATAVAWATKWAMWAAIASAIGAVIQAGLALYHW